MNTSLTAAKMLMEKFLLQKFPTVFTKEAMNVLHVVLILLEKLLLFWFQTRIINVYPLVNQDVIDSQMLKDNFVICNMDVLVNSQLTQQKKLAWAAPKYPTVLFLTPIMKHACNASDMEDLIHITSLWHLQLLILHNLFPLEEE